MPKVQQYDTNRSDLMQVFGEAFGDSFPYGLFDSGDDYDTTWRFSVSNGVGILSCVVEEIYGENAEDFEWELNLRG